MTTETIAIIGAIATVTAGLGGSFLGAIISYQYGLRLLGRQEFNKAGAKFKSAFVDEIFRVRRNIEKPGERYLERPEDIAITNEKAKIIFEAFLPNDKLPSFNAAWDKYINPKEINEKIYSPLNPEHRKELGAIHLSHINTLLEFAKPKL